MTPSQQALTQLASLQSRPGPAADTVAQYQALPVAHHPLEEAAYQSGALGLYGVVGWPASLDPPTPHTRHDDAAGRRWVEVPNLRDIFHEGGVKLFEKRPPDPLPW